MHKLYDLKEMLCRELEDYSNRDNLDINSLEIVDKLAHAVKNIDKIIESEEEQDGGMSGRSYRGGMYDGGSYRGGSYREGSYRDGGMSYARGRGRNARRDSMGRYSRERYSRDDNMADSIRDLMENAPDEQTRMELQRMMEKFE